MQRCRVFVTAWIMLVLTVFPQAVGAEDGELSDVVALDDIVISATRTPTSLDNVAASSSIVPEKQIRSSVATDLGHLLESTNLLDILDYGPGGISRASIRGSSSDQVLVLVDGERLNDALSSGIDLDNVPIGNAERIEILRGGQSAMYGADAVGGIINIITKQPVGAKARAWSTLGAYNSVAWGMEASKRIKTVSGLVSFSRMSSESDFSFQNKYGEELIRENADFTKENVSGKLNWDISGSAILRLYGDYYDSYKGDPGPIGQFTPDANKRDESIGLRGDLEQRLGKGVLYKLSGYKRDTKLQYVNPQGPYPVDDTHEADAVGAELQAHLLGGTSIPLVGGISLRNEDITSTALGDHGRETYSAYIQQELSRDLDGNGLRLSRIALFPALRWDHYSDFEAGLSPKIGVLASFGEFRVATIRVNVGESYRAPSMNDLYWPADAYAVGNPDLKPERARNVDAGLYFHLSEPPVLSQISLIRCSVSYFRNSFRDRIQWTPGGAGKWSPQNLSEAISTGLEAEMRLHIFSDLISLGANYTFLKAEDMLGRQLVYRPRHALGYTLRVGAGTLWGQIRGSYRSKRYYTVQNTKWIEPFIKHDFQLGTERSLSGNTNLGLIFEVKNILDTKYQHAADYPLPGREWSIKASIGMEER